MSLTPIVKWTKLLNLKASEFFNEGLGVTTASDGSVYVSASLYGWYLDGEVAPSDNQTFIVKFNSEGDKQWTKYSSENVPRDITTGSNDSIYITGRTLGNLDSQTNSGGYDVFISKFDSDGDKQWSKLLGSNSYESSFRIGTGSDDSIYITGQTQGDLDSQTNSGSYDVFISKFNSDGEKQWTKLLGSNSNDTPYGITIGNDDSIYIAGSTLGNFDGQTLDNLDGLTNRSDRSDYDRFISKFSSDGEKQWTKLLGRNLTYIRL